MQISISIGVVQAIGLLLGSNCSSQPWVKDSAPRLAAQCRACSSDGHRRHLSQSKSLSLKGLVAASVCNRVTAVRLVTAASMRLFGRAGTRTHGADRSRVRSRADAGAGSRSDSYRRRSFVASSEPVQLRRGSEKLPAQLATAHSWRPGGQVGGPSSTSGNAGSSSRTDRRVQRKFQRGGASRSVSIQGRCVLLSRPCPP